MHLSERPRKRLHVDQMPSRVRHVGLSPTSNLPSRKRNSQNDDMILSLAPTLFLFYLLAEAKNGLALSLLDKGEWEMEESVNGWFCTMLFTCVKCS